jgi:hypothetical protein
MSTDEDGNMCGCGFACLESCQCIPSEEQVDYESYQECRAQCCDPDDGGRCCYNEVIKNAAGDLLSVTWYDCVNSLNEDCEDGPIEPTAGGGTRQITSRFTKGVDCDEGGPPDPNLPWGEGCPIPEYGACCILDGNDVIECIEETKVVCDDMPNRPGDFPQYPPGFTTDSKSSRWSDCTTHRDSTVLEDFACDDCNGKKDCACESDERCDNNLSGCTSCYDNDPSKRWRQWFVLRRESIGRLVTFLKVKRLHFYIRNCTTDAAGNQAPVTDRKAKIFITGSCGESQQKEIEDQGQFPVDYSGTLYVTGVQGIPEVQVCITLERDVSTNQDCDACFPPDEDFSSDNNGEVIWESSAVPVIYVPQEWEWEDGYPQCFTGGVTVIRFERRWTDNLRGQFTRQWDTHFFTCDNGSMTDVTQFVIRGGSMTFALNCNNGAQQLPVAVGLTNLKGEYSWDAQLCVTENTWDAYGMRPGLQGPPPEYDICGRFQCPETGCEPDTRNNPLP